MNPWQIDLMAEYQRRQALEAKRQIRLEDMAYQARIHHPGIFERSMFNFANWMISTGKRLRKRYEIPAVKCTPASTEGYAQ
jgi:hypothetical protein